jgi:hypothetical protein
MLAVSIVKKIITPSVLMEFCLPTLGQAEEVEKLTPRVLNAWRRTALDQAGSAEGGFRPIDEYPIADS